MSAAARVAPPISIGAPSSALSRMISVTASPVTRRAFQLTALGSRGTPPSACSASGGRTRPAPGWVRLLVGGRPVVAHRFPQFRAVQRQAVRSHPVGPTTGTVRRSARSSRGRRRARRCSRPGSGSCQRSGSGSRQPPPPTKVEAGVVAMLAYLPALPALLVPAAAVTPQALPPMEAEAAPQLQHGANRFLERATRQWGWASVPGMTPEAQKPDRLAQNPSPVPPPIGRAGGGGPGSFRSLALPIQTTVTLNYPPAVGTDVAAELLPHNAPTLSHVRTKINRAHRLTKWAAGGRERR